MSRNLSRQLHFVKDPVRGAGAVAAQNQRAADIGAAMLAEGGNAVDAAIATAFALGAVEPWMSGVGGIGFMMEFDLQLWYRRIVAWSLRCGSVREHRQQVAAALLEQPGKVRLGMPLVPA